MYRVVRPLLFAMDAERAHVLTIQGASFLARHRVLTGITSAACPVDPDPRTRVQAFGIDFPSPVGLAAGLDKDGVAVDFWGALGFGFVEVGTVTPGHGQPGNDRPRLERIVEDEAIVNRMGFNNEGSRRLAERLARRRTHIPVGANIGKAKETPLDRAPDDYESTLTEVWPCADYVAVNVSSPNTPGLRDLQAVSALEPLLRRVIDTNARLARERGGRRRPILLKIAPDLADEDVDAVADLAQGLGVDGIIATNTTVDRSRLSRAPRIEGGVSGRPLKPRALALVRRLRRRVPETVIVGVGGISTPADAYERIRAGATLVQIYTAFVYQGPGLARKMVKGLSRLLEADGFTKVEDAVGVDA